ncbi:MAG: hypothetical protein JY451_13050 [Erythrobacter sp.]|nr:MAG: hypothetical protein JY451_13050 [Erythrobacter sp.]
MARSEGIESRGGWTIAARLSRGVSSGLAVLLLGSWGAYSNLEAYQKERIQSTALIQIAALAPDGSLEPYQEERLKRALTSDD